MLRGAWRPIFPGPSFCCAVERGTDAYYAGLARYTSHKFFHYMYLTRDRCVCAGMNHVHPQQATGHSSIYRYESNRHGSYRYESVMLWSSCETRPCAQYTEQQSASGGGMALVCGGAVAALYPILGAIFWGRYSATCFEDMAKWQLTLLWPFLYLCNSKFRKEFNSVFQDKPNDGSDNVGQVSEAGL